MLVHSKISFSLDVQWRNVTALLFHEAFYAEFIFGISFFSHTESIEWRIARRTNAMVTVDNKRRNNVNFNQRLSQQTDLNACVCHGIMSAINVISHVTFHFFFLLLCLRSILIVIATSRFLSSVFFCVSCLCIRNAYLIFIVYFDRC